MADLRSLSMHEMAAAIEVQRSSHVPVVCLLRDFGDGPWLFVWPPGAGKGTSAMSVAIVTGIELERKWRDRFVELAADVGFERAAEEVENGIGSAARCVRIGTAH